MPWLGEGFLAEIVLPDADPQFRFERTTKSDGHYTLWGDPTAMLEHVVRVTPIRTDPTHEEPR